MLSDYRIRGVSVSERRPAASLSLADDLANGVYFGATVMGQQGPDSGVRNVGHMEYVGYAARRADGLAWEVGADNQDISVYAQPKKLRLKYSEAYVGLSNGTVSTRVYYSPNYLHSGLSVAYGEVNGVLRPAENWRLNAHLGLFEPLAGTRGTTVRRDRLDLRLDVARRFGPAELAVGWTTTAPAPLPEPRRGGSGLVASATIFF